MLSTGAPGLACQATTAPIGPPEFDKKKVPKTEVRPGHARLRIIDLATGEPEGWHNNYLVGEKAARAERAGVPRGTIVAADPRCGSSRRNCRRRKGRTQDAARFKSSRVPRYRFLLLTGEPVRLRAWHLPPGRLRCGPSLVVDGTKGMEGRLAKDAGVIEAAIAVQGADRRHLIRGQLEVEERKVLD
jgi:hypothetical protein